MIIEYGEKCPGNIHVTGSDACLECQHLIRRSYDWKMLSCSYGYPPELSAKLAAMRERFCRVGVSFAPTQKSRIALWAALEDADRQDEK